MPWLDLPDIRLRYNLAGQAPDGLAGRAPVVFLHGLGSSADDWQLQASAFGAVRPVAAVDLRGHGGSSYSGALTVPQMAADVARLVDAQVGRAHVVGLSLGGCVALALAILRPELPRSLTLVNTFARYRPAGAGGLVRTMRRLWLLAVGPQRALAEFVAAGLFPKGDQGALRAAAAESLSRNSRRSYWNAIQAIRRFDARAGLGTIRCPTLVVVGDRDATVPAAAGQELASRIAGARLWRVPDSGHATPIDQPEVFNRTVLGFQEAVEAGRPFDPGQLAAG